MHKIYVDYRESSRTEYCGYRVSVDCALTVSSRWVGMFQDLADAVRFATWKATELGIELELHYEIEESISKAKKREKKK